MMRGWITGLTAGLSTMAAVAWADNATSWSYGDWRVDFEAHDSIEDDWLICSAHSGGDGLPSIHVSMFEGDAGPPHGFPDIKIHETAPRHYKTVMQDGQSGYIVFEDGTGAYSTVHSYFDEDGIENAWLSFHSPESQVLLQSMAARRQLDAVAGDRHVNRFSLKGFTAAYLKMMELCGLDGTGVVN